MCSLGELYVLQLSKNILILFIMCIYLMVSPKSLYRETYLIENGRALYVRKYVDLSYIHMPVMATVFYPICYCL